MIFKRGWKWVAQLSFKAELAFSYDQVGFCGGRGYGLGGVGVLSPLM
jgi:hypothetical protein